MSVKAPLINRSAGRAVPVDISDGDNLALNETAVVHSMSLFDGGDPLTLSSQTDLAGAPSFTSAATDSLGNTSSASAPLNVDTASTVTVADGASVEIKGGSAQSVTFAGTTGTLEIDHSIAFKGLVSGLSGADTLDLADISFGTGTTATFLGNAANGTLTVTDGTHTANVALRGDYLASSWTLSSDGNGGTFVVDPIVVNPSDGSANAPANTPQMPTLLSSYAARPAWNVAGVDYAVGYASGTTLHDPSTISMAGVSVDKINHVVNISGNNVTLSGYDFSLNGGWGVSVNSGSNIAIQNSKFIVGSNGNTPIYISPSASNVTIQNNLIDGAGTGAGGSTQTQILVAGDGTGTTTIQYNLIQNAWGQNIVMSSDVGGENWVVQYNVIKNAGEGYNSGAHGDWIQTYNLPGANTNSFAVNYNTFVQTDPIAVGRTQGISAFSANSGSTSGGVQTESFNNNTFIANNNSYVNYAIILDTARLIGTGTIQNNYFDITNIGSANGGGGNYEYVGVYNGSSDGPYHGTVTQSNNVNMVAGTYFGQSGTPSPPTAPAAPTIASFSTDSGVVGDHITNDNTLTLSGTAAANSTVKVFDGTTQIGTATANGSGVWSSTAAALADGSHNLTATATNASGTSSASAALAVTIDTVAPNAPVETGASIVSGTTKVQLTGMGEANSTLQVFDGTTQVGTATANSSGAWSLTTGTLAIGGHSFTTKATDAAGNTSLASAALAVTIPSAPTAPAAPTIASFSPDTGVVGDGITDANTLTLTGTAAANSTLKVFDGSAQIGTTTANSSGSWSYITSVLTDAIHVLTATDTVSGVTSAVSSALTVTVDTVAPNAPVETGASIVSGTTKVQLTGTAEANSTLLVFDGTTQVGTATANSSGAWSLTTGALASGGHSFTTKATDAAGNTSLASAALAVTIPSAPTGPAAPTIASFSTDSGVVGDHLTNDNTLALAGTAVANSTVKVFDGPTQIATATADGSGTWSFTTAALADGSHNFTATATNASGTSSVSAGLAVKIDTVAPNAPVETGDSIVNGNQVQLTGTAEANSTLQVYDGTALIGTATTNATGNWTVMTSPLSIGAHAFTTTATDAAGNTSAVSLPLDPVIGTTIESIGSTSLVTVGNNFYLNSISGGSGPELKYAGAAVAAGQFGAWTPIGVEQTATGYEVAWKIQGADNYSVWNTDSSGKYLSNAIGAVSGKSAALESLETSFHQDLNGDGTIGLPTTVIESAGSTSLVTVGDNFYLNSNSSGSGPALKYAGAAVAAGQFGAWTPIGVEQTATGYEVAWKIQGADNYSVWNTDSSGKYVSNAIGAVSGKSAALESLETSFHQDLNGDGTIGVPTTVIESAGSTSLVTVGDNFYLNSISSGSGPALKYAGAAVAAGQFGAWTPIGVEQTATGYEVAWKIQGADNYSVWNTDSSGKYLSNAIGAVSGKSAALESLETSFHQDLNGDGTIGVPTTIAVQAPASAVGLTDLSQNSLGIVTLKGTADASSPIQIFDGTNVVGTATTAADGTWTFTTPSAVSDTLHTFTAQEVDSTGHVVATSSGAAIMAASNTSTLTGTGGNDFLFSSSSNLNDTFVFASNFGHSTIEGFSAAGSGHDTIQFSKSVFDSFASVLAHATQTGQDVVISADASDSVTLKNTKLGALNSYDFHFA